ncbi:unknown protein (Partial), partial [Seminavis robusta]|eukprot:Sro2907_g340040.1 n/a (233) ;mRNA; f:9836-10535
MASVMTDREAPVPYIRTTTFKADEVKFEYEQAKASIKKIEKKDQNDKLVETTTETTTAKASRKVYLKTYGHTSEEDAEHAFEALEKLQTELEAEFKVVETNKANDATLLFKATKKIFTGSALTEWNNIVDVTKTDWEAYKTTMAKFMCTVVLKDDAYNEQTNYMRERIKPMGLTTKQWWLRLQTMNRYLKFFIKDMNALKRHCGGGVNFKDWWNEGGLSDTELRRIVTTRVPL